MLAHEGEGALQVGGDFAGLGPGRENGLLVIGLILLPRHRMIFPGLLVPTGRDQWDKRDVGLSRLLPVSLFNLPRELRERGKVAPQSIGGDGIEAVDGFAREIGRRIPAHEYAVRIEAGLPCRPAELSKSLARKLAAKTGLELEHKRPVPEYCLVRAKNSVHSGAQTLAEILNGAAPSS